MGIGGPNPGIWGEAVRKALNPDEDGDANAERALLDTAELRELERSELYGETPEVPEASRRRRFLDWLFRRSA
jgi:hypothetical protein